MLPDKICLNCSDDLLRACEIRSLCLESDTFLRLQVIDPVLPKNESIFKASFKVELMELEATEENYKETHLDPPDQQGIDVSDNISGGYECVEGSMSVLHQSKYDAFLNTTSTNDLNNLKTFCEVCGKAYTKRYFTNHIRTHSEQLKEKAKLSCKYNEVPKSI